MRVTGPSLTMLPAMRARQTGDTWPMTLMLADGLVTATIEVAGGRLAQLSIRNVDVLVGADPARDEMQWGSYAMVPWAGRIRRGRFTFDGVDYSALGHLHGSQRLRDGVRYSGSPMAYSFSEERHHKGVLLVDLAVGAGGAPVVEHLPTPVQRPLARIAGRLDELLTDPQWSAHTEHFLQVTLTDATRPREPMERLRARFPYVLVLVFAPEGETGGADRSYARRLRGRTDLEVAADYVEHVRSTPEAEESTLLAEAFESVRLAGASA